MASRTPSRGCSRWLIIFCIARFAARLIGLWFNAVERGRLTPRWIYPETAQPTRRLLTGLLWVFAIVVAYPYLPGSQTDAFKGVSVFLGLMVTFGSSGLVNQIMSGFMITYSRALRSGDFVRIGDVEGTVTHLGVLSTKVKTLRQEEVTIPNAVVVAQTTTDYSRPSDTEGVFTPTSVTIGYDAPWRQVHSLLLLAAERTAGLRREPNPIVLQTALEDFYVKYTLLVCLERQQSRLDHPGRAAREHPGPLQRARRADHVAELRPRSRGAESGAERRLVRRAGRPRSRRGPIARAVLTCT